MRRGDRADPKNIIKRIVSVISLRSHGGYLLTVISNVSKVGSHAAQIVKQGRTPFISGTLKKVIRRANALKDTRTVLHHCQTVLKLFILAGVQTQILYVLVFEFIVILLPGSIRLSFQKIIILFLSRLVFIIAGAEFIQLWRQNFAVIAVGNKYMIIRIRIC